ncbi:MAG: hypothetical protein AAFN59_05565 [Pseudomonadota bacterium]
MKLALLLSLSCAPLGALANMVDAHCDDSSRITTMMKDRLGAEQRAFGLRDPETMLEVWVEPRTGDWTIVQNYANGTSCIVAAGEHWEDLSPQSAPS